MIWKSILMVRKSAKWLLSHAKLGNVVCKAFKEQYADGYVVQGSKCTDQILSLCNGCELMVNDNIVIEGGFANGTSSSFEKAVLKPSKNVIQMKMYGQWINAVHIEDEEDFILCFDESYKSNFHQTIKSRMIYQ